MTIRVDHLTVRIGNTSLIENVSFTIVPGEILAVVGPNGAGKSTALKALAGEISPSSGDVIVQGQPLGVWRSRDLARVRAVLPQRSDLSFGFAAGEVVLMGRTPHLSGGETRHDHQIAYDAMCLTRTEHFADRVYTTLSGGERQRVQLARVLAQIWEGEGTRYLLLDEPTNNLDLSHQHSTLSIARRFAERGVGVLAILHDLNLAAQYADRIVILKGGRVLAEGTPHEALTSTLIKTTYDISVLVQPHPRLDCPLVVPLPQTDFTHRTPHMEETQT
ncbi:MAG: heme ABC transporter ATP-binding protein [Chloroflexota bacterium]